MDELSEVKNESDKTKIAAHVVVVDDKFASYVARSAVRLANVMAVLCVVGEFVASQTGKPWVPAEWVAMLIFGVYGSNFIGSWSSAKGTSKASNDSAGESK
jgi:hypothetical protein